jgi:hypothetical protein
MDRMIRPKAIVVPEAAQVPTANLISPPKKFTHALRTAQPFYYALADGAPPESPAGELKKGTKVIVASPASGKFVRVVDSRGLSVWTLAAGLVELPKPGTKKKGARR